MFGKGYTNSFCPMNFMAGTYFSFVKKSTFDFCQLWAIKHSVCLDIYNQSKHWTFTDVWSKFINPWIHNG